MSRAKGPTTLLATALALCGAASVRALPVIPGGSGFGMVDHCSFSWAIDEWNTGLVARKTADNAVYNRVLSFAGARPTDRDSVDKRIVASVRNRTGQISNCVAPNGTTRCSKNAGGWPTYAQNRRPLTLPSNQASIASNGYSNLENWLNSMDKSLAGAVQDSNPAAPPVLSVQ